MTRTVTSRLSRIEHEAPQSGCRASKQRTRGARWAVVGLLSLLSTAPASSQTFSDPQPAKATLAIVGGYLIDGHEGPPVHNSMVLVNGKEIVAVGTIDSLKVPQGAKVIDAAGYTVMPGLIDPHVHLDILGMAEYPRWHQTYAPRYEEIMAIAARQLLMAGVTTAAELGGKPEALVATRNKIERGQIPGPRMKMTMSWIANFSDAEFNDHFRNKFLFNAHTADEARAAVLKQISYGSDIAKLMGGVTAEQVKVVAEEAHKRGMKVTGHSSRADVLMRIRNGQDRIEHMGFDTEDPEVLRELRDRRITIVPTNIQSLAAILAYTEEPGWADNPKMRALTPPAIWADIRSTLLDLPRKAYFQSQIRPRRIEEQGKAVKRLYDAGIRVLVGTDTGSQANFHTDGMWQQMDLFVRCGIPPAEVISAATRLTAAELGLGDKVGAIEPGKLADIIVVDGNPLRHMRDLKHVVYVIKEGVQYKGPEAVTTTNTKSGGK